LPLAYTIPIGHNGRYARREEQGIGRYDYNLVSEHKCFASRRQSRQTLPWTRSQGDRCQLHLTFRSSRQSQETRTETEYDYREHEEEHSQSHQIQSHQDDSKTKGYQGHHQTKSQGCSHESKSEGQSQSCSATHCGEEGTRSAYTM